MNREVERMWKREIIGESYVISLLLVNDVGSEKIQGVAQMRGSCVLSRVIYVFVCVHVSVTNILKICHINKL